MPPNHYLRGLCSKPAALLAIPVFFCGLSVAIGPLLGFGAIAGLLGTIVLVTCPVLISAALIAANTCFQILGASHLIGLPISLSKICGLLALAAFMLHVIFARWQITWSHTLTLTVVWLVLTFVWDLAFPPPTGAFLGSSRSLQIVLLSVVIAGVAGQNARWLFWLTVATGAAMACTGVIAMIEHFLPQFVVENDDPAIGLGTIGALVDRSSLDGVVLKRVTGGLGDSNWLAISIAISAPLGLYFLLRAKTWLDYSVVSLCSGLAAIALVLSYTRTGFIGLGFAGLYLLYKRVLPVKPILAGLLAAVVAGSIYMPAGFMDRMFSSKYLKEGSTPIRRELMLTALDFWTESPIVGHGYSRYGISMYAKARKVQPKNQSLEGWFDDLHKAVAEGRESPENIGAHNLYLEILTEYGLIGLVCYLAIFFAAWRDLKWVERNGDESQRLLAICLTAGFLTFLVCGMLVHVKYLKISWILLGLTVALRRLAAIGDSDVVALLQRRPGPANSVTSANERR